MTRKMFPPLFCEERGAGGELGKNVPPLLCEEREQGGELSEKAWST